MGKSRANPGQTPRPIVYFASPKSHGGEVLLTYLLLLGVSCPHLRVVFKSLE